MIVNSSKDTVHLVGLNLKFSAVPFDTEMDVAVGSGSGWGFV